MTTPTSTLGRIVLPRPAGQTFHVWASQVVEILAKYGVQAPPDESVWQDWACNLLNIPQLSVMPQPFGFKTWTDWAQRAIETF